MTTFAEDAYLHTAGKTSNITVPKMLYKYTNRQIDKIEINTRELSSCFLLFIRRQQQMTTTTTTTIRTTPTTTLTATGRTGNDVPLSGEGDEDRAEKHVLTNITESQNRHRKYKVTSRTVQLHTTHRSS